MFYSIQKLTPPGGHKIALYVRSATGDENAISRQIESLNTFINNLNSQFNFGRFIKFFSDSPASGMNFKRPGLTALLDSVQRREFDLIIVTDLLRLSRSSPDFWKILKTLFSNGCNLISLQEFFHLLENEDLCDALNKEVSAKYGEVQHA